MQRILASSVIRGGDRDFNGWLYEINWTEKKILRKVRIPNPEIPYLGPRGGARGARGVASTGKQHFVANFNTIFVFNESFDLIDEISNSLFNGIHEIDIVSDGIWVSSTGIDAVLKVDWTGKLLEFYYIPDIIERIADKDKFPKRNLDFSVDQRFRLYDNSELISHLNSVKLFNQRPYVCCNKLGSIIALEPNEIIFSNTDKSGFHNGMIVSTDVGVVNSSNEKRLYVFDPISGQKQFSIDWKEKFNTTENKQNILDRIFNENNSDFNHSKSGWNRGLAVQENGNLLIGSSPALIIEIDATERRIEDIFIISENVSETIHGLTIIPDN